MMQLHTTRSILLLALCFCFALPISGRSSTDRTGDVILGRWHFPSKGSSVDVYRSGNRYFARVAETDNAGIRNYGLAKDKIIMSNLEYDGQVWGGGELIHPKTGHHLDVELSLTETGGLRVLVYKGIKLLHKQFVMTR
ncbi:hypothetical protein GCM10027578_30230 [Spirosoma luteolum]